MVDASSVYLVIGKELKDARRSRWFLLLAVVFAGLALALSLLGMSALGALAPSLQNDHAIRELPDLARPVSAEEQGLTCRLQPLEQLAELAARPRIQVARGFIQEQDRRVRQQRHDECQLLPHAARKLADRPALEVV